MKKVLAAIILCSAFIFSINADEITFSATESQVRLKDGMESVVLAGEACVETGSITIRADEINLSGKDWGIIECTGSVSIVVSERNLSIITSLLWYDRINERLLIASYFEIEDRENGMSASANHLEYDMAEERLKLKAQVRFSKINGDDVITGKSESFTYDRENELITLQGRCSVIYKGDSYEAEQITLDMENDSISLSSAIRGTING